MFSLSESYLIEDGKLTAPLKGVNLIGNGPDVLRRVDMLGSRLSALRRHLDVRQGWPVGPGQRRHADGSHLVDHRRRHAGMSGAQVTEQQSKNFATRRQLAVELAKKAGADDAEVLVRDGSELTAKVRLGEPELVQEAGSRALGLRVLRGGRRAVTYTSDLRREALEALCTETVELADLAEPDEYALPPDPALLAKTDPRARSLRPARSPRSMPRGRSREAKNGEAAARRHDTRVTNSEGATWSRVLGATAFATSGGFVGGYRGSYASLVVEPLCDDTTDPENPKKRNGYWWTASRFLDQLEVAEAVGIEAARRTVATLGSRKVDDAGVPDRVRSRGRALDRRHDLQRRERLVVLAQVELPRRQGRRARSRRRSSRSVDDPLIPRGPGSRPFDGDGLATRKNMVVDKGMLGPVLCDVYSGRKLGRASTGSAGRGIGGNPGPTTSNLVMEAGTISREELLKQTRARPLCHLARWALASTRSPAISRAARRASGSRSGELTFPVSEVTIAANFDEILKRIDLVANDLDPT